MHETLMQRFLLPKRGCKRQRSLCTCQRLCTVMLHSCYPWRSAQKDIFFFFKPDPSSKAFFKPDHCRKAPVGKQQRWDCSASWGAPCPRTHHPKGNTAHLAVFFFSFPATVCIHSALGHGGKITTKHFVVYPNLVPF